MRTRGKEIEHLTNDLLNVSKQQSIYIPLKASQPLYPMWPFKVFHFNPDLNKESKCCTGSNLQSS